jgi:DNA polymerase III delta prime subunit
MTKINITIKNLFRGLGIDNNRYEELQTVAEDLYVKTPDSTLVPILGFVKKSKNRILKITLENGISFKCSENHIIVTKEGPLKVKYADSLLTLKGFIKIISQNVVGEDDVYDISLPSPHLYVTPNSIIHHNTSLAKILVNEILDCQYLYINASDENGIDAIRGKVVNFAKTKSIDGKLKVVLLDEADQISSDAQKALRNVIEEYASNTRFILTCNYLFKVIPPLQSRCQIINLIPPTEGVVQRIVEILKKQNITIPEEQKPLLIKHVQKSLPDLRRIINDVQKFSVSGILQINNDSSAEFAETVFNYILDKKDLIVIRKTIIENERLFSSDYRHLQKQLFEIIFKSNLPSDKKTECLLTVSKGMELDAFVIDKEINCFTMIINLFRSIYG